MPTDQHDDSRQSRSWLSLMIIVSLAIAAGRIAVVTSAEGDTAFLSANDRSRWCTIASLVERGTYVIDQQIEIGNPVHRNRRPWGTIDKVRHTGSDGELHYYSSKPPLFPTMVAGVYKLLNLSTGMTMTAQPIYVPRIILALVNLPMLAAFLIAIRQVIAGVCQTRWGEAMGMAAACFGTMMLPFTISLNNHLPAAAATAAVMAIYIMTTDSTETRRIGFGGWLIAGALAAFAAANELPALSMTVFWFGLFVWADRRSILPFAGGALVVAIAFFATNWIAHDTLRPPYAHRGLGQPIAEIADVPDQPDDVWLGELKNILVQKDLIAADSSIQFEPSDESGRFRIQAGGRLFAVHPSGKRGNGWQLSHWDDWYEYPGSYWQDGRRRGVDRGEASRAKYFLHMTVGHYGIFSLTPIWILLPFGFALSLHHGTSSYRRMVAVILIATLVCGLFYLSRPMIDRNYGGVSTCFRWLLWFSPLWLVMIAPVFDSMASSRRWRFVAGVLLSISVFSMSTALSSPWQSPWLYRFWQFLGWIDA